MNQVIKVLNSDLTIKEFKGQRVVTFRDIDLLHQRPEGTAKRNFKTNKIHFIRNEDYFLVKGLDEIRTDLEISKYAPTAILITESGYLMLVKSFTDDLAWDVQRQLVNRYFKKSGDKYLILKQKLDMIDQINSSLTKPQKLQLYAEAMEETELETGQKFPPLLSSIKHDPVVLRYKLAQKYFNDYLSPNKSSRIEVGRLYYHYRQYAKYRMVDELLSKQKFIQELLKAFPSLIYHKQDNRRHINAYIAGIVLGRR